MPNIVPITPHDVVLQVHLPPGSRVLLGDLSKQTGITDPREILWRAWRGYCQREFGKVRYRRYTGTPIAKHKTFRTAGQKLVDGHVPESIPFQFQYFMDALMMSMALGRAQETDPSVLLCQAIRELADDVFGKVAARKIVKRDDTPLSSD